MDIFEKAYTKLLFEAKSTLAYPEFWSLKAITRAWPCAEQIQTTLLDLFNFSSWAEFIDAQRFGECERICKYISKLFPKVEIYEVEENFSDLAVKKLNELNDFGEMFGTHYIVKNKDKFYDFAKGANSIKGVYLQAFTDDMQEKYLTSLSDQELKNFIIFQKVC